MGGRRSVVLENAESPASSSRVRCRLMWRMCPRARRRPCISVAVLRVERTCSAGIYVPLRICCRGKCHVNEGV